jgi:putative peptide zinc metalloprotease protein
VPSPRSGGLDLVLADGRRLPLTGPITIGRSPDNAVRLADPSVSRRHARISVGADGPVLQDVGSRYGTWLDGRRIDGARTALRDGSRIRLGDQELTVVRRRTRDEAGATMVVPVGASAERAAVGAAGETPDVAADAPVRPRLRSGYALKRLDASEGADRWVLRDLRTDKFLRLSDDDAQLLELVDGRRNVLDLVQKAVARQGPAAAARLARLLTELEDRGLLAGGEGPGTLPAVPPPAGLRRWFRTRRATWRGAADVIAGVYRRGGWLLFTRPAVLLGTALAAVGVGVFCALVLGRYGTPFIVASKIGPGALVFLVGRMALVAAHELGHGLALSAVGRRVGAVGVKVVLVFPYAFVDTSEAWLEPRRSRITVSAAGPFADLVLGAGFAIACLQLGPGTVRDITFQLALAAYVGALLNLNPFVDRDGYQILVDLLRMPGLRRRARVQLEQRLGGTTEATRSRALHRYAVAGLAWSVVAAGFAAALSLRYRAPLEAVAPRSVVWGMLAGLWLGLLTPALVTVGRPVLARVRRYAHPTEP